MVAVPTDKGDGWRAALGRSVEGSRAQIFIIACIIANAVTLGLETSPAAMAQYGGVISLLDDLFLAVFTIELGLKLIAFGPRFFSSGWNIFDLLVVGIAYVPSAGPFAVLRALRVLRIARLFSVVPQFRRIIEAMLFAIPGMAGVIGLLGLLFYIFAVLGAKMFGPAHPEQFGSLGTSMYTLMEVMTLDGWSEAVVGPVMETHPWALLYFIPFIIVTTFAVLNLFIGLIVNAMESTHGEDMKAEIEREKADDEAAEADRQAMLAELQAIRAELAAMKAEQR